MTMTLAKGEQVLEREKRAPTMIDAERRAEIADLWAEVLEKTGEMWITVKGNCMSPLIQNGDSALISRTNVSELVIGDVVTFNYWGSLVTHRVIGIVRDNERIMIMEKGDYGARATMVDSCHGGWESSSR